MRKGKGTSGYKVNGLKINTEQIDLILQNIVRKNNFFIWLVEIKGKRNAFLCGKIPDYPLVSEIERFDLKGNYKLFVQGISGVLNDAEIEEIKKTGVMIERFIPQL